MKARTILINYTGRKGAGPLLAYETAKAFQEKGEKVVAVISSETENYDDWMKLPIDKVVPIHTYDSMKTLIKNTLTFPFVIKSYIKKELKGYDITHIYCPMDTLWSGLISGCFPKAKRILVLHDPLMHSGGNVFEDKLFHKHARRADHIFVHSKKFVAGVQERFHTNTSYIPLGRHNTYMFLENKEQIVSYDNEKINFMFFGRIEKYKGLDVLGEAYKLVWDNMPGKVSLTVVGNGDFSPYQEVYSKLENVQIVNRWIKDEEVDSVFRGANIINICPYKDATQSGVVLVAMDYGVPCIVTRTGGLDEQVDDHKTGLVVEPSNSKELANAMIELAKSPDLYKNIQTNAYEVIKEMSWENVSGMIFEVLENM